MKRLFIAIFAMLAVVGVQAQVVTLKSDYDIAKLGMTSVVEVIARVEICNDVTTKYCVLRAKHSSACYPLWLCHRQGGGVREWCY